MTGSEAAVEHTDFEGVRRIVLNRPEAANALRPQDRDCLVELFEGADRDPNVRVVVLAAEGRHFCAGADVRALAATRDVEEGHVGATMAKITYGAQRLVSAILDCRKPVVAVVQGPAAGIGAHLAYAADLVVATESATFVEAFVLRGLVVDGAGAYLLPRRIGMQRAKEMTFLGDPVSAAEAASLGLVNRVVAPEDLDVAVEELVSRLAVGATSAIGLTKRLLNDSLDTDRAGSFIAEAMSQEIQNTAKDANEGIRAFVERRLPNYIGR